MDTSARQALNALIDQLVADPATRPADPRQPAPATAPPAPRLVPRQRCEDLPDGARSAILWRSRVA